MVDPDEVVRFVLTERMLEIGGHVIGYENLAAFSDKSDATLPGVVVFGPSDNPDEVISQVTGLIGFRPGCGAVMVVYELTAEVLQGALRAGVDDVVAVTAEDSELPMPSARASARVKVRRPAPVIPTPAPAPSQGPQGRVITVFGTKGGTGKSVVATNLAVALARRTIQPVVLVDADLQFGDVALMLQLDPSTPSPRRSRPAIVSTARCSRTCCCGTHTERTVRLGRTDRAESADRIGRADLVRILEVLRERCA